MSAPKPLVGVIGGSGLYKLTSLSPISSETISTPWGETSSPVALASLPTGQTVAFIARHGLDHTFSPSEIPSRANIAALKHLGVEAIVAFSAVGSLREDIKPRDVVVPSQIIDRTKGVRPSTYFQGLGVVGHAAFGDPFDAQLARLVGGLIREEVKSYVADDDDDGGGGGGGGAHRGPVDVHEGKTVVCMEGPQFSTRAESNMYRQWGGDLISMSVLPEAKLARECELSYCLVSQVTDYDAWRVSESTVTVAEVMATIASNVKLSNHLTLSVLAAVHNAVEQGQLTLAKGGMQYSVMTGKDKMSEEAKAKLGYILPYFS